MYGCGVPTLWNSTIDEHRRTVHGAILDAAATLVTEHGLAAVTMSQIATTAGIGRATLYKYFPDVQAIVVAWHERLVAEHLDQLTHAAASDTAPAERLRLVLATLAELSGGRHQPAAGHDGDLAVPLHRAEHLHQARHRLHQLLTDVVQAAADAGAVRNDVPAGELATFCRHALGAAAEGPGTRPGRDRLIELTLAALRPHSPG